MIYYINDNNWVGVITCPGGYIIGGCNDLVSGLTRPPHISSGMAFRPSGIFMRHIWSNALAGPSVW